MKDARSETRRVLRVTGFASLTASMLAVYRAHDHLARASAKDALRERYVHAWSSALLRLFGIEVETLGGAPPGAKMVVSNHRSTIDIGVLLREVGGHVVSRDDLARWPLVGAAARSVGTVFVDRDNASSGVMAIRSMARLLQDGHTVSVFPEGTTFAGDEVRPFHKGAFVAAKMAAVPVVPVGLAYGQGGASFVDETFLAHLSRLAATRRTRVAIAIGDPLPQAKNAERAAEAARARVQELVNAARSAVER